VLELVPNDHNVRIHLSELYKEMGDAEAALHVLETQETSVFVDWVVERMGWCVDALAVSFLPLAGWHCLASSVMIVDS
jgi:hypothetical protein